MVMMSSISMGSEAGGMYYALQDEKWHKYYSSFHHILLVGEGDFSFSLCLAKSFGSASNIVATCLDSKAALFQKYKQAKENVETLEKLGATVLHGVDATEMQSYFRLQEMTFDRIVYNFPHSGFKRQEGDDRLIRNHRSLVFGFFRSARSMLRPDGEVHVNHKTTAPFSYWNLPELASCNHLVLFKCCDFKIKDFPGYRNKRGDSKRCDEPFPLGECSTFMFVAPKKISMQATQIIPFPSHSPGIVRPPPPAHSFGIVPFERETVPVIRPTPTPPLGMFSSRNEYTDEMQRQVSMRSELLLLVRLFGGYSNHVEETFGETDRG